MYQGRGQAGAERERPRSGTGIYSDPFLEQILVDLLAEYERQAGGDLHLHLIEEYRNAVLAVNAAGFGYDTPEARRVMAMYRP